MGLAGTIRGSEEAHNTPDGYLSRDAYIGMTRPTYFTTESERSSVYDVFERYRRYKQEWDQQDVADR